MARIRKRPDADAKEGVKSSDKKAKTTLRERNRKAAESKQKPKRIRRAAAQAKRPASRIRSILTTEYHVLPRGKGESFFTKSRTATPNYFKDSVNELKNVTWPGRKETWKLVFAVFIFSIVLGIFIALLDFGLEQVFKKVIL